MYNEAKYCRNKDFLDINPRATSSHGWRSLLVGRDLLKKGLGIAIRNGEATSLWKDSWLALIQTGITTGPAPVHLTNATVATLIDERTRSWNEAKVKETFPYLWEQILQLIPSKTGAHDQYIWTSTKDGSYSTKTGYYMALQEKENEATTERIQNFKWKQHIWNINTTPKANMTMWRAVRESLPVGRNLQRRNITPTAQCIRCGEEETETHLFFNCSYAKKVWSLAPFNPPLDPGNITDMMRGVEAITKLNRPTQDDTVSNPLSPWILWALWTARNKYVFENRCITEEETIETATNNEKEWTEAQNKPTSSPPQKIKKREPFKHLSGAVSCYTYAAWTEETKKAGMAWIFMEHGQNIIVRGMQTSAHIRSPMAAESMAIYEAMQTAQELHFHHLQIASEASNVINAINNGNPPKDLKGIFSDINRMATFFRSISFNYVPRSKNILADSLAKTALRSTTMGSSVNTFNGA